VSQRRILVTGSGGFIGRRVVERLQGEGVEIVAARGLNLFDPAGLGAALQGVDAVIHTARDDDAERMAEGVRRLLAAAQTAGARRFVQLSSVAVYGAAQGVVTEETPQQGPLDAYARSKTQSEADCQAAASAAMTVAVMRPSLVYGPGSAWWTTPFVKRLASGQWRGLGPGGEGRANLIHVDDVARFAAFLATHDTGPYAVFNANGPEAPTWNAYLDRFADALGVPRPQGQQSTSMALAAVRRVLRPIVKQPLAPSRQELDLFRLDAVYAMDKAKAAGFACEVSLDQGLADCAAWARAQGLVR